MFIELQYILILIAIVVLGLVAFYNFRNKIYNTHNNARPKVDSNNEPKEKETNNSNTTSTTKKTTDIKEQDKVVNDSKNNNDVYITGNSIDNQMNENNNEYSNTQQKLLESKSRVDNGEKNIPKECYLLNDLLEGQKPTYENADPNMTLYKGYEWEGLPREKLSYCSTKCSSCDIINNEAQSGLWGTTLDEASKTDVGSILPKFIYHEINDDGKLI